MVFIVFIPSYWIKAICSQQDVIPGTSSGHKSFIDHQKLAINVTQHIILYGRLTPKCAN